MHDLLFSSRVRIRIRVRNRFSVWLCTQIFLLLSIVTVTLPFAIARIFHFFHFGCILHRICLYDALILFASDTYIKRLLTYLLYSNQVYDKLWIDWLEWKWWRKIAGNALTNQKKKLNNGNWHIHCNSSCVMKCFMFNQINQSKRKRSMSYRRSYSKSATVSAQLK